MLEQVGVNAPGREKTTHLFPLKRSALETSFHLKGLGLVSFGSLTRALKVTDGIMSPSFADMESAEEPNALLAEVALTDANALAEEKRVALAMNILITLMLIKMKYQGNCEQLNSMLHLHLDHAASASS